MSVRLMKKSGGRTVEACTLADERVAGSASPPTPLPTLGVALFATDLERFPVLNVYPVRSVPHSIGGKLR
jgi:hypothetical protein